MEAQTLRYYLILFSLILTILYLIYLINFKIFNREDEIFVIQKNESIYKVVKDITKNENYLNKKIISLYFNLYNRYYNQINYGRFNIKDRSNLKHILKIITDKSNIDFKLTIIEGWEKYQLDNYLSSFYPDAQTIPYNNLIANTYIINSSQTFNSFKKFLIKDKKNFFDNYKDNKLLKQYGIENIMILASLVEKEAKNKFDKKLISSVIFNRINAKMKLQIDATVIASITHGFKKLNRPLTYSDLKINDPLNTYIIKGIPKEMISYVGKNTLEILLENHKSDFLFYFYNIIEKKHIFSKNYNEHKKKLNEYRKKNK